MVKCVFLLACLLLGACGTKPPTRIAIVGAALYNPPDSPIPHSVILVEGGRIQALGTQQDVPVPAASQKINGIGKSVWPAGSEPLRVGSPANLLLGVGIPPDALTEKRMRNGQWVTP